MTTSARGAARLDVLGPVALHGGVGVSSIPQLTQPRPLAVLAYLLLARPRRLHSRDTLLALLWPESDQARGRHALRNVLHSIRKVIGDDAVVTSGDDLVGVAPGLVTCDALELEELVARKDYATALSLYHGDLLAGFHVSEAAEFEEWLYQERVHFRGIIAGAAAALAEERVAGGDIPGAIHAAERHVQLVPEQEGAHRRLMQLLAMNGERVAAMQVYERLQVRMRAEYGTEPSRETRDLVASLRNSSAHARLTPSVDEAAAPAPVTARRESAPTPSAAHPARSMRGWWLASLALVLVLALALRPRDVRPSTALRGAVLVLPMVNGTGNVADDYIASTLSEDIARRLAALPLLTVRSTTRRDWPPSIRDSITWVAREFGVPTALRSRLTRVGDSLRVTVELVDVATGTVRQVVDARFVMERFRDAGSEVAANIAGTVYRVPLPAVPRAAAPTTPEAHRLAMLGWHQMLVVNDFASARGYFLEATNADPGYARAWSGLSSTWSAAAVNGLVPFETGFERAEAAARRAIALDSLEATALANLGVLTALQDRNLAAGEPYFRRAFAAEPSNPEVFLVYASTLRFARQWDRARDAVRIARRLDPLSAFYAEREANGAMCEDKPVEALALYRSQVELDPADRSGQFGVARALARLGRWDEAIAQLGVLALSQGDTALATRAAEARGEAGYWGLKHQEGRALLESRRARAGKQWTAPYLIGVAEIGAGLIDQGMTKLESEVEAGSTMVYKLPCNPEIDEVRPTARFMRLLEQAGSLPLIAPRQ